MDATLPKLIEPPTVMEVTGRTCCCNSAGPTGDWLCFSSNERMAESASFGFSRRRVWRFGLRGFLGGRARTEFMRAQTIGWARESRQSFIVGRVENTKYKCGVASEKIDVDLGFLQDQTPNNQSCYSLISRFRQMA